MLNKQLNIISDNWSIKNARRMILDKKLSIAENFCVLQLLLITDNCFFDINEVTVVYCYCRIAANI